MSDNKELIALLAFASTRAGTVSDVMVRRQLLLDTIAALEADKQGEAVAWMTTQLAEPVFITHPECREAYGSTIPLYTHPQPYRKEIEDEVSSGAQ